MKVYKMATKAFHKLGDISRDEPDLIRIVGQDKDNYYGTWVCGFGFFNVRFPKGTTRNLTKKEVKEWSRQSLSMSGQHLSSFTEDMLLQEEDI